MSAADYQAMLKRQQALGVAPKDGYQMREGPAFACPGRSQKPFDNRRCWAAMPVTDEGPQCTLRQCRMKRHKRYFNLCEAHYDAYMAAVRHEPALGKKHIFEVIEPFVAGETGDPAVDKRLRSARKAHQYGLLYAYNEIMPKYNEAFAKLRILIQNSRAVNQALACQKQLKTQIRATRGLQKHVERLHNERAQAIADAVQRANNGRASRDDIQDAVEEDATILDLRTEVDALRTKAGELERDLAERVALLEEAERRAERLQARNAELQSKNAALGRVRPEVDEEMANLKASKTAADARVKRYEAQVAELDKTVRELHEKLLRTNIVEDDEKNNALAAELATARAEIEEHMITNKADQETIATQAGSLEVLRGLLDRRLEQMATLEGEAARVQPLEEQFEKLQEELNRLKMKQRAYDALDSTNRENAAKVARLEAEVKRQEEAVKQARSSLAGAKAKAKRAEELESEVAELKAKLKSTEAERANLEVRIKNANAGVRKLQAKLMNKNERELKASLSRVTELESRLASSGPDSAGIREELRAKSEALTSAQEQLRGMQAENQRLNTQIEQLQRRYVKATSELEAKVAQLEAERNELKRERDELRQQVESLGKTPADPSAADPLAGSDQYPDPANPEPVQTSGGGRIGGFFNFLSRRTPQTSTPTPPNDGGDEGTDEGGSNDESTVNGGAVGGSSVDLQEGGAFNPSPMPFVSSQEPLPTSVDDDALSEASTVDYPADVVEVDDERAFEILSGIMRDEVKLKDVGPELIGGGRYEEYKQICAKMTEGMLSNYRAIKVKNKKGADFSKPLLALRAAIMAHLVCGKPQVVAAAILQAKDGTAKLKRRIVGDLINASRMLSTEDEQGSLPHAFRSAVRKDLCSGDYLRSLDASFRELHKSYSNLNTEDLDRYLYEAFHGLNKAKQLGDYMRTRGDEQNEVPRYIYQPAGGAGPAVAAPPRIRPPRAAGAPAPRPAASVAGPRRSTRRREVRLTPEQIRLQEAAERRRKARNLSYGRVKKAKNE